MKKTVLLLCFLPCLLLGQIQRPVGINLSGVTDWSPEFVFVDAFKQSRQWIPHTNQPNAPWSSEVPIPLRADGYPLVIPFDNGIDPPQTIRSLMFFGDNLQGLVPSGAYRLIVEGIGKIRFWGAANGTFNCPVDTLVMVDGNSAGVVLEIDESIAADPIHNIRFIMHGFHQSYQNEPFHPELLDFLKDFQVIRFMDWMRTNGSETVDWNDRALPFYYTQTLDNGMPYEYIVELCNLLDKDPWLCVPHRASDDYITEMAQYFHQNLAPGRKIYIEYSNEVWNGIFSQNEYADSIGLSLGYSGQPWERAWKYTAKRSADVFRIFHSQISDPNRFVKIIPAWAANDWVTNFIIDRFKEPLYNPDGQTADAVAVAPYFGGVADAMGDAGLIPNATIEQIVDSMAANLPEVYAWIDGIKQLADQHNLRMMAYEGGQHLVAGYEYHNDEVWVEKLLDANRHPKMRDLYCQYLDYWYDSADGDLFCLFSSHGGYGKWGAWGIKEHYADTLAPKYQGVQDCVFALNSTSASQQIPSEKLSIAYPNPSLDGSLSIDHSFLRPHFTAFSPDGRAVQVVVLSNGQGSSKIQIFEKGLCYVVLEEKGVRKVVPIFVE